MRCHQSGLRQGLVEMFDVAFSATSVFKSSRGKIGDVACQRPPCVGEGFVSDVACQRPLSFCVIMFVHVKVVCGLATLAE